MKMKKTLIFLLFFLAGILLGGVIGVACKDVSFLNWLSYSTSIGFGMPNGVTLDLAIMKLAFGFSFEISVAQIICIILSLAICKVFSKGL